jgi:phospholipid/cholesterol/gamma-HCH transport system permease protein
MLLKFKNSLSGIFFAIGASTLHRIDIIGDFTIFCYKSFSSAFKKIYLKNTLQQLLDIGFLSITIVSLTGLFTGAVLALQSYNGLKRFGAEASIPPVLIMSLVRELGPVLSGLIVSGRVSSMIAAQISSMAISNQISSMKLLSVNPLGFIILPRILAGIISAPLLNIIVNTIGFLGGYLVCVQVLNFTPTSYVNSAFNILKISDIIMSIIKSLVFGFIISAIGCYIGYNATGGSKGVGMATTKAVIFSSISILVLNYILTAIMF